MITVSQLTDNIKSYINLQLEDIAISSPVVGFTKPLIKRALDKNFNKVEKYLDLISDNEGNVDVENILTEMIQSVMNTKPFILNIPVIGNIEIGNGQIILNIPLTNKRLVLGTSDLETFKEMLVIKK